MKKILEKKTRIYIRRKIARNGKTYDEYTAVKPTRSRRTRSGDVARFRRRRREFAASLVGGGDSGGTGRPAKRGPFGNGRGHTRGVRTVSRVRTDVAFAGNARQKPAERWFVRGRVASETRPGPPCRERDGKQKKKKTPQNVPEAFCALSLRAMGGPRLLPTGPEKFII